MIYLDNAATTAVRPEVVDAMLPYYRTNYSNPSGVYGFAGKNKNVISDARDVIASVINAKGDEIYFTSGGSESDNWALKGIAWAYRNKGRHIITTKIEHHAILHSCDWLEKEGYDITYIDVDEAGVVRLDKLETAIREDTILISVMFANNEIGTIQPVKEIGRIAHMHGVLFHTDAVQAFGQIPIDVNDMNIDMLSASSHKFNGPKGTGFLYIKSGIRLDSIIHGGGQERGRRAGTENVPAIVGMKTAAELAATTMTKRIEYEKKLRNYMIKRIMSEIPYARVNGSMNDRLPGNVNMGFQFVEGETVLIMLDMEDICASAGSACSSGSIDPSHVLMAIGLPEEIARGSVRFTIGYENTMEEIDRTVDVLKRIIGNQRKMSDAYLRLTGQVKKAD